MAMTAHYRRPAASGHRSSSGGLRGIKKGAVVGRATMVSGDTTVLCVSSYDAVTVASITT